MPRLTPRFASAPAVLAVLAAPLALAALGPAPARAQTGGPSLKPLGPGTTTGEPRWLIGGGFGVTQPVHEFRQSVRNQGIGGMAFGLYRLGGSGALALRLDGNFVQYGRERRAIPIFPGVGRVTADLVTTNSVAGFTLGPQLMAPSGAVRPYAFGGVGTANFSTVSSVQRRDGRFVDDNDRVILRNQNASDWTLAGAGGGGLLVRLGGGRRSLAFLDVGARYQHNGRARYLTRGGIRDNADGSITTDFREGQANFWTYHVGFAIGTR